MHVVAKKEAVGEQVQRCVHSPRWPISWQFISMSIVSFVPSTQNILEDYSKPLSEQSKWTVQGLGYNSEGEALCAE